MLKKITKKLFLSLLVVLTITISISTLYAQEETDAIFQDNQIINPRTFALGITTLKEHGFGVKARLRWQHFAIDGAVGSMPWLIMYETTEGETVDTDFDMSLHGDLGFVFFINNDQSRFQNGIRIAGVYDSIGGQAGLFGWTGELTFTSFAICFGLGFQYYPDVIEKLNEHFPDTQYAELDSSQKIQYYLGVILYGIFFNL